jgi:hypothetical protein
MAQQIALNLNDKHRQIGASETQIWGRDTMVFDIRRDMFVVRERRSQRRVVGM